jgi:hypothetical protein
MLENAGKCWKMLENAGKMLEKCWKNSKKIITLKVAKSAGKMLEKSGFGFFFLKMLEKRQKNPDLDFFAGKNAGKIQNGIFFPAFYLTTFGNTF